MDGIAQCGQKRLIFIVVTQVRTKMTEKGKREKNNMKMDKSNEKTLIYIYMHMYIYTHPRTYKLHKYRYTYSHKHITYYSSQIVLFDIMFESI